MDKEPPTAKSAWIWNPSRGILQGGYTLHQATSGCCTSNLNPPSVVSLLFVCLLFTAALDKKRSVRDVNNNHPVHDANCAEL